MTRLFGIGLFEIRAHGVHIGDSLSGSHSWLQMSQRLENPTVAPARVQLRLPVHLFLVDDRHKEIGRDKQQSPLEPRRRYPNYRERMLIQPNRAAHHASIILETAVPIGVGEHDIRGAVRATLIGAVEDAAKIRLNL